MAGSKPIMENSINVFFLNHPYTLDPIWYQYRYEFRVSVWVWIFSRVSVSVSGYRWNTSFWGIMMVSTIIHEFLPMYVLYSLFGSSVTYQCSRAQCAPPPEHLFFTVTYWDAILGKYKDNYDTEANQLALTIN